LRPGCRRKIRFDDYESLMKKKARMVTVRAKAEAPTWATLTKTVTEAAAIETSAAEVVVR